MSTVYKEVPFFPPHRGVRFVISLIIGIGVPTILGCPEAPHSDASVEASAPTSGQGDYQFRVKYRSDILPRPVLAMLAGAHGGFAVDRRPERGEVYFAVKGAGLIRLRSDLSQAEMLQTAEVMRPKHLHNAELVSREDGSAYLLFPSPDTGEVFATDLDGKLIATLEHPPEGFAFDRDLVTTYFREGGAFKPTDVTELNQTWFIPTGYSDLDAVLTAHVHPDDGPHPEWRPESFGNRGEKPEEFFTAHGVTIEPDGETLSVTDRVHHEIDRFKSDGTYLNSIPFPEGSQPCDIDYFEDLAVVASLVAPKEGEGAPIYLLKNDEIVSTVLPRDELGLDKFHRIHHAVLHRVDGRLMIIALAWMPGDFAVLEQVTH